MLSHEVNFARWRAEDLEPEGYRPEGISYHSSVIELVESSLKRMKSPSILQIGRLGCGFLELVTNVKGRLVTLEHDSEAGDSLLEHLGENPRHFDAIFLWDRMLFVTGEERRALLNAVSRCSTMGSSLVLYTSTRHSIPARPSGFSLTRGSRVEMKPTTTLTTTAEVLEANKLLPGWRCMRATQLRNGFREHLLVKG
jgi:hypothetical protein